MLNLTASVSLDPSTIDINMEAMNAINGPVKEVREPDEEPVADQYRKE